MYKYGCHYICLVPYNILIIKKFANCDLCSLMCLPGSARSSMTTVVDESNKRLQHLTRFGVISVSQVCLENASATASLCLFSPCPHLSCREMAFVDYKCTSSYDNSTTNDAANTGAGYVDTHGNLVFGAQKPPQVLDSVNPDHTFCYGWYGRQVLGSLPHPPPYALYIVLM